MRPAPARLTEFFLLVSVGGVLGGIFAALIAPVVFNSVFEYPIAIVLALAIVPNIKPAFPAPGQFAGALTLLALGGALCRTACRPEHHCTTSRFDLLLVDAFSSDAIPVHLMTVEAIKQYLDVLSDDGVILLHISSRHFELAHVLGRITDELDLVGVHQNYEPIPEDAELGSNRSHWVLIAEKASDLSWKDGRWEPLPQDGPLWTDDYSDILSVLDC